MSRRSEHKRSRNIKRRGPSLGQVLQAGAAPSAAELCIEDLISGETEAILPQSTKGAGSLWLPPIKDRGLMLAFLEQEESARDEKFLGDYPQFAGSLLLGYRDFPGPWQRLWGHAVGRCAVNIGNEISSGQSRQPDEILQYKIGKAATYLWAQADRMKMAWYRALGGAIHQVAAQEGTDPSTAIREVAFRDKVIGHTIPDPLAFVYFEGAKISTATLAQLASSKGDKLPPAFSQLLEGWQNYVLQRAASIYDLSDPEKLLATVRRQMRVTNMAYMPRKGP